jgi:hypothetical protein
MYSEDTPEPWRHGEDGCKGSEKKHSNVPRIMRTAQRCIA